LRIATALVQVGQRRRLENVYAAKQVALGDAVVEMELVEQPRLVRRLPPSIIAAPSVAESDQTTESPFGRLSTPFSTASTQC
jgi:hypothetical protein